VGELIQSKANLLLQHCSYSHWHINGTQGIAILFDSEGNCQSIGQSPNFYIEKHTSDSLKYRLQTAEETCYCFRSVDKLIWIGSLQAQMLLRSYHKLPYHVPCAKETVMPAPTDVGV